MIRVHTKPKIEVKNQKTSQSAVVMQNQALYTQRVHATNVHVARSVAMRYKPCKQLKHANQK